MKRFLKIVVLCVGAVALLAGVGVVGLYAWSGAEIKKRLPITTHAFVAPTDSASVARGEHVVRALVKCADCHGEDLGGKMVVDDPAIGRIYAPNLTRGRGGIGAVYTDADWEQGVRHGVARDGRRLILMPSEEYQFTSDEDLGAVVAYLRSVAAVDREPVPTSIGPVARALYAAGQFPLFSAASVTHVDQSVPSVPIDSTVAYGKYLGEIGCSGCHGMNYGGGKIPGTPPDWPHAANLTPTGLSRYTFAQFDHVLRTGERPDGSKLHPMMPIQATKLMTDVEMVALYKYLTSLPARPFGSR